jgi:uncharacterized damage-inducible protein DinB
MKLTDELYRAMEWSDARMWSAVHATPAAASDQEVREKIHHLHMVQRAFLTVWRGAPERPPQLDAFPDTFAIEQWARTYYPEARDLIASLDEDALSTPVALPWAARIANLANGDPGVPTLEETLLQVVLHSTHHRGQIMTRISELGGKPPLVDYIAWIWLGKPAAVWNQC